MSLFSVARRRRASLPPINGSSDAYPPDDARSFPVCAVRAANRIPSNPVESNRYRISSNRNLVVSSDRTSSVVSNDWQRGRTKTAKARATRRYLCIVVDDRVRITSRMVRDSRTKGKPRKENDDRERNESEKLGWTARAILTLGLRFQANSALLRFAWLPR